MAKDRSDHTGAWTRQRDLHVTDFEKQRSPRPLQALAIVAWVLGFALQAAGVLCAAGRIPTGPVPGGVVCAVALVLDLVLVLWGASQWRSAGVLKARMAGTADPGQGLTRVALSSAAFVPMALFFLVAKNAGSKAKLTAVICAVVAAAAVVALAVLLPPASA